MKKRSFNPNFDKDNKPVNRRPETGDRRPSRAPSSSLEMAEARSRKTSEARQTGGRKTEKSASKHRFKKPPLKKDYPRFDAPKADGAMRLNRFIAHSGACSRREADTMIAAGAVEVNGVVVSELGAKVMPADVVRLGGEIIHGQKKIYVVMNKPKGFVTSLDDPHHPERTVMDIIGDNVKERIYPVGRLDKNSLGVLLITNDGDLTKRLTHPSFGKKKIYQVTLNKALTKRDMEAIAEGVELEDGPIRADAISYAGESKKEVGIEIHSGRNRIVRRIFEHLGYQVSKLDRVYFAGLTKQRLKRGQWRFLTPKEVGILKSGEYE